MRQAIYDYEHELHDGNSEQEAEREADDVFSGACAARRQLIDSGGTLADVAALRAEQQPDIDAAFAACDD